MKIGYHLTAYSNWRAIQKNGLVPYHIRDHESKFLPHVQLPLMGIWIWLDRLDETSEPMSVAWHCGKKKIDKVAVLSVQYDSEDVWTVMANGKKNVFSIIHHINFEFLNFYENSKATLLKNHIPPAQIGFVKLYDWSKYINIEDKKDEQVRKKKATEAFA